jgi:hypothetical protein
LTTNYYSLIHTEVTIFYHYYSNYNSPNDSFIKRLLDQYPQKISLGSFPQTM